MLPSERFFYDIILQWHPTPPHSSSFSLSTFSQKRASFSFLSEEEKEEVASKEIAVNANGRQSLSLSVSSSLPPYQVFLEKVRFISWFAARIGRRHLMPTKDSSRIFFSFGGRRRRLIFFGGQGFRKKNVVLLLLPWCCVRKIGGYPGTHGSRRKCLHLGKLPYPTLLVCSTLGFGADFFVYVPAVTQRRRRRRRRKT